MNMLPDGAEDRLMGNAQRLADACRAAGVQQWDLVGFQAYGQQVDIEAGKVTMAAGGGEGGFGVRVVENGRFGFAHMVDVSGADDAVAQALKIAKMSPQIDGFVLHDGRQFAIDAIASSRNGSSYLSVAKRTLKCCAHRFA